MEERLRETETIILANLCTTLIMEKELCMIKMEMLFNLELGDDFFFNILLINFIILMIRIMY
jgi:hypothetical protein